MANQITISPPATELTRGEPMAVSIVVALEQPLKVRGIHAEFLGAEETQATYTTTTTDSKGRTTTQTHTAVERTEVTTQAHLLTGSERLGFFGNLSDAFATIFGAGQHEEMSPGRYEFEIEICVPADAPPTHKGSLTRVFYELSVQVDVPLAFDLKASQSFEVAPHPSESPVSVPVLTRYPDDGGRGLLDSLFAPNVKIELSLAANCFRLGDLIEGSFSVESLKPLNCDAIRVRLVAYERSTAHGHADLKVHQTDAVEIARPGVFQQSYRQPFSLVAQTSNPLTAKGSLYSIEWFAQAELDVPWAKNPQIRAPIVLLPECSSSSGSSRAPSSSSMA